jgi:site-specific DNA recombinase
MSQKLRAALYARYSTDNQRKESLDDQFRECEVVAEREGFEVVLRFSDKAISSGTASRPGYQSMLEAARAHEFDVLITEDVARLWRNRAEFGPRSAELEDLGIHWLSCVGQDTRRDGWGLVIQILHAMAEAARKEASYRTRRGLRGKALNGKSTGGRAYGYTSVPDPSGERNRDDTPVMVRVIDRDKEKTILQIYKWRADGWSGQRIARELNDSGVPPPGATWKRTDSGINRKNTAGGWTHSCIVGDPRYGTGILNNPLYRGEVRWGRTTWTPAASDSNKRMVKNTSNGWVTRQDETLRIVPDDLWWKVHAIQTASNPRREAVRLGIKQRKHRFRSRYLLGGTLVCSQCGSNYIGDSRTDYVCPAFTANSCTNSIRFRRDDIHEQVFELLTSHLLSEESLARGRADIEAQLREAMKREEQALVAAADSSAMAALDEQTTQLRKLKLAPRTLQVAIAAIEREREELLGQAAKRATAPSDRAKRLLSRLPEITAHYHKLVAQGVKALSDPAAVTEAAEAVRSLLVDGRITLSPNATRDGVMGTVQFKELGDYVLHMNGIARTVPGEKKPSKFSRKLIGSGGRI